jgi:hypothetical protein
VKPAYICQPQIKRSSFSEEKEAKRLYHFATGEGVALRSVIFWIVRMLSGLAQ